MKNICYGLLIGGAALILATGCISAKSYVDPLHAEASYENIQRMPEPYKLDIVTEFQRKGKHLPRADKELRGHVERVVRATGFAVPVTQNSEGELTITVNNFGDTGSAAAKGFGTGLTFGLVGSMVTDHYEMIATLSLNGRVIRKGTYQHALHTTIGNKSGPEGLEATTTSAGFGDIIEDLILVFIKEAQDVLEPAPTS